VGGRGSGKTRGGAVEVLRTPPNTNIMVIAPTNMMLRDGAVRTLTELAKAGDIYVDYNKTHMELLLKGGRRVLFRSAERPDRIRGNNIGFLWFDELAYCKPEIWEVAIPTLREQPRKVIGTTTPNGKDFVYDIFHRDVNNGEYEVIHSTTMDNIFVHEGYVDDLRSNMTEEQFRQEGLGQFIDPSGSLFNRAWFKYSEVIPTDLQWYRYWDLAMTVNQSSDYTASARVALDRNGIMYIDDVKRMKAEYPEVRQKIIDTMREEPDTIVGIEQAVSGFAVIQELKRLPEIADIAMRGISVDKDKKTRASSWASRAERGDVILRYAPFNKMFLDEVASFPKGVHDDMVDAVSGCVQMMSQRQLEWEIF
jgi:predicted phage terminase large subunit-like protein